MGHSSCDQNFEDLMLWRALEQIEHGFYIDAGVGPPDADSVTRLFSKHGRRGINIEVNPELFAELAERRPSDVNLNLAVGAREGVVTINFVKDGGSGLPTIQDDYARLHHVQGWETEPATVSQFTLTTGPGICRPITTSISVRPTSKAMKRRFWREMTGRGIGRGSCSWRRPAPISSRPMSDRFFPAERRDPGPCFSTRQYLEAHALPLGTNSTIHYRFNRPHQPAR
jgi:hypothetical protein